MLETPIEIGESDECAISEGMGRGRSARRLDLIHEKLEGILGSPGEIEI